MNTNQPNPNRERADQAICAALNNIQKMVVPAATVAVVVYVPNQPASTWIFTLDKRAMDTPALCNEMIKHLTAVRDDADTPEVRPVLPPGSAKN